jgi:hypothetical protein
VFFAEANFKFKKVVSVSVTQKCFVWTHLLEVDLQTNQKGLFTAVGSEQTLLCAKTCGSSGVRQKNLILEKAPHSQKETC